MRRVPLLCALLLLGGCASDSGAGAHAGEAYVVNSPRTQFFKFGPAQANGADFLLDQGARVKMLSREYGFSNVALADGETGYVPTENLSPAPPLPKPSPTPATASRRSHRGGRAPTAEEESEVPPPDLPKPEPASPKFRY